jgi:uncharacterized protein DUF3291
MRIAQVNIARMKAPLDDPLMAGFVGRLDEINALADWSPGFVWRLQTEGRTSPSTGRPNSRSRSRAVRRAIELLKNSECRIQNRELRNEICSTFFILNSDSSTAP